MPPSLKRPSRDVLDGSEKLLRICIPIIVRDHQVSVQVLRRGWSFDDRENAMVQVVAG